MKLLTFLGLGNYGETEYVWQDQSFTTKFAPAASCRFVQPDQITVFLTEEAEQKVFPELQQALPGGVTVEAIPVPKGNTEQELWQIFSQVSSVVKKDETVAFDVTHGLRSFPLVGLLSAAFLQSGMGVQLQAVFYGAYDVRDQSVTPNRTPMFDLTPMLKLLEWSTAADRFNRTGDARYLATLVAEQKNKLALQSNKAPDILKEAGKLGSLASGLTDISQSLHLIRPALTMQHTADLPRRIEGARSALARLAATRPFEMVLGEVENKFSIFGQTNPNASENLSTALVCERRMIQQYAEWELWVQAITLAREWIVSWFMLHLEYDDLLDRDARTEVEKRINEEAYSFRMSSKESPIRAYLGLARFEDGAIALDLWNTITNARNDIDHAGMRKPSGSPESLISRIKSIIETIERMKIPGVPV